MSKITIRWHDIESAGWTDIFPSEWFSSTGLFRGCEHSVRHRRLGCGNAKCDLTVRRSTADLDYKSYKSFNRNQDMLLGVMRLRFSGKARRTVTQVLWRAEHQKKFVPFSTTIGMEQDDQAIALDDDAVLGLEGRKYLVSHLIRERKPKLVQAKKAAVLKATGKLACEACTFVFSSKYGALGEGYCEVHHRVGLSSGKEKKVRLKDLAILCSNCHRMIHRTGPPMLSVEAFAKKCLTHVASIKHFTPKQAA